MPTRYIDCDISIYSDVIPFEFGLEYKGYALPEYTGPYVVEPKLYDQTLDTVHKSMTGNVLVKEVPVHEIQNDTGGYTLIIMS